MAKPKKQQTSKDTEIIYIYPEDIPFGEAYLNKDSCLNPIRFHDRLCHECKHSPWCVYKNKYKYKKLS